MKIYSDGQILIEALTNFWPKATNESKFLQKIINCMYFCTLEFTSLTKRRPNFCKFFLMKKSPWIYKLENISPRNQPVKLSGQTFEIMGQLFDMKPHRKAMQISRVCRVWRVQISMGVHPQDPDVLTRLRHRGQRPDRDGMVTAQSERDTVVGQDFTCGFVNL